LSSGRKVDRAGVLVATEVERAEAARLAEALRGARTCRGRWQIDAAEASAERRRRAGRLAHRGQIDAAEGRGRGALRHRRVVDLSTAAATATADVEIDLAEAATHRRGRGHGSSRARCGRRGPLARGRRKVDLHTPTERSGARTRHGRSRARSGRRSRRSRSRGHRSIRAGARHEEAGAALGAAHLEARRRDAPLINLIWRRATVALDLDHDHPSELGLEMYHGLAAPRPKVW
jgi:hypothetical protein